jgi:hypothetical protein
MSAHIAQLLIIATLSMGVTALAQNIPKGYVVPKCTLSPDSRFGVTVPILDDYQRIPNPKNSVIELKTGKVIAVIEAKFTGWNRQNHGGVLPCRWSPDGSLLLWEVDGKWFSDALVLLKFKNGELERQVDILHAAQTEMLARTKRAAPSQYPLAKKGNVGNGSAYPEGFTIAVAAADPISLPLKIQAALTSNPKQIEGNPQLGSELTGFVDERGNFNVADFRLRDDAYEHFEEKAEQRDVCPRDYAAEEKSASRAENGLSRLALSGARKEIYFHPRNLSRPGFVTSN